MVARILVVDRNQAFAIMLQEMLENEGGHQVETTYLGSEALERLRQNNYDLTIIDMDLDPLDMGYQELIQGIRRLRAVMRIMLIPLMGQDLPPEARRFDIQGTLSKPFFADDLLPNIREALSRPVKPAAPAGTAAAPARSSPASLRPGGKATAQIQPVLADLARETRADSVLFLSYGAGEPSVLAQAGGLDEAQVTTLARLSVNTVRAAGAAAAFLGPGDEPFEHNMFESESLRLYIMALAGNLLLVIVTPISTPLGTIRHNLRRASRDLAGRTLT